MKKSELRKIIKQTIKEQMSDYNVDKPFPDPPPPPPPPPDPPGPYPGPDLTPPPDKGKKPTSCDPNCNMLRQLKNNFDWDSAFNSADTISPSNPPAIVNALAYGRTLHGQIIKIWEKCCEGTVPGEDYSTGGGTTSTSGAGPGGWTDPGPAPGAGGWPGAWDVPPTN